MAGHGPHAKTDRDSSLRAEQEFCEEAMASGAYDSMGDKEWVALCEKVAGKARRHPEDEGAQGATPATDGKTPTPADDA